MNRPDRNYVLMHSAILWGQRSTCSRASVGVVISKDGRILSSGYNGAPAGMAHCNHSCDCGQENGYCINQCRSLQPCSNVVHAEANAIAFAAKYGVGVDGAELHTTRVPCLACAGLIINAGITRVVWKEEHREMRGYLRLGEAGIEVIRYDHE